MRHLRVEMGEDDQGVWETWERVESLILAHLERGPYEPDETVPAGVQQAALLALTAAYDERDSDPLTPGVISLLSPYRSPGVW